MIYVENLNSRKSIKGSVVENEESETCWVIGLKLKIVKQMFLNAGEGNEGRPG